MKPLTEIIEQGIVDAGISHIQNKAWQCIDIKAITNIKLQYRFGTHNCYTLEATDIKTGKSLTTTIKDDKITADYNFQELLEKYNHLPKNSLNIYGALERIKSVETEYEINLLTLFHAEPK